MTGRSEAIDLLERDLRLFFKETGQDPVPFFKSINLRHGLFKWLEDGHSVNFRTYEKCYAAMDDSGWVSIRRRQQWVLDEAMAYKPGNPSGLFTAVHALQHAG